MGTLAQTTTMGTTRTPVWANTMDGISPTFTAGFGLGQPLVWNATKKVADKVTLYGRLFGNTYQWYGNPDDSSNPAAAQFNMADATYLYIALG